MLGVKSMLAFFGLTKKRKNYESISSEKREPVSKEAELQALNAAFEKHLHRKIIKPTK